MNLEDLEHKIYGLADQAELAKFKAAHPAGMNTWIKVIDEPPSAGDHVLIAHACNMVSAGVIGSSPILYNYGDECSETLYGLPVTHWMRLPELPK